MKRKTKQPFMTKKSLTNSSARSNPGNGPVHLKLGLDLDLRQAVVAMQCDGGEIGPAQKCTRAQLLAWVKGRWLWGTG